MRYASVMLYTDTICLQASAGVSQRDGGITVAKKKGNLFSLSVVFVPPTWSMSSVGFNVCVKVCVCAMDISQQNWITLAERTLIFLSPYHG